MVEAVGILGGWHRRPARGGEHPHRRSAAAASDLGTGQAARRAAHRPRYPGVVTRRTQRRTAPSVRRTPTGADSHAHRNSRDLQRDAGPGQGGQVRLPGDQRDLLADPARRAARLRRGRERRHHPDLDRRRGVPGRPAQQGHGDRRRRPRRVRAHRRRQVRHHRRAAHRPLPQGQAGRLRPSAAGGLRRARRQGPEPALPVAHVGRLRRDPERQPGHRPGAARRGRRGQDHP